MGQLHTTAQQESEKQKPDSESKVSGELGSKTNPVRCKGPQGERAYLNRLRCMDEEAPEYHRIGSLPRDHTVTPWMDIRSLLIVFRGRYVVKRFSACTVFDSYIKM